MTFARFTGAKRFAHALQAIRGALRGLASRTADRLMRADPRDLAAAVLFSALFVIVLATFSDYAISNDEEVQQRYAELIVAYYASGFADHGLFHFRDLYLYGGLFDVVALGFERILPLDPYEVRHILSALTGLGGIAAVWATARTIAGPRAALLAAALIAACGIWYGAMFDHTKDIPFAAAMMGAVYYLMRIGRELPRPRWHLVLLFGLLCGCALGIRVLGLLLVSYAGVAVLLNAPLGRGVAWRDTAGFVVRSAFALVPALVLAYLVMIAAWPWAAQAALNPLRAIVAFDDFHYPIQTVLAGHIYRMADVPRWYVPAYVVIKLTLPLLAGATLALVAATLPRSVSGETDSRWRKETALIAFAALFPLLCDVATHGPGFTGMRHFLFTVPPFAVLAGLGLDAVMRRLESWSWRAAAAGLAIVLLFIGTDAVTLYRLHPDEYLFFNPLVGGLAGASRQYDTDYWVNIMPEAVEDLEQYLDRTEPVSPKSPKRRYLVGVCGERLPFEKEADSRLQYTRDWARADFFIAPTHMNCDRALDGRIIASVQRLGVLIGVVKDRRSLLRPNQSARVY